MSPSKNWFGPFATTMALAAALGAGMATAVAGDGADPQPKAPAARDGHGGRRGGLRQGRRAWLRGKIAHVRKARHELTRSLAFTDAQQRTALEKARAAQPILAEARKELARVLVQDEQPAGQTTDASTQRGAKRDAVRDLRRRTAEKQAPLAKDFLATLTPEQRAKIEGFAAARGRKVDDEKLTRRVAHWLARPMTAEVLEAKLGK